VQENTIYLFAITTVCLWV